MEHPFLSDHAPVLLRIDRNSILKEYPFKFNARWLSEPEVMDIVTKVWKDPTYLIERDSQQRFVNKTKSLKIDLKSWSKEQLILQEENLTRMEDLLTGYHMQEAREPHTIEREIKIK